ncbi:vWA domain-containing protein [Alkaliphilus sp. B6464]|uniref:vWA domain-containing protein n=1 Tax=Alkaliphilus sp. B6464 TaxID=2731219 RepID=UPI001BA4B941|nr:VWA domain-containing protein [Alkaliphilus sp. B6464]QUH21909.1 VWA domain-containing protein [Alkaliphilus sp. B6464]
MKIKTGFAKEIILNREGLNHMEIELIPPILEVEKDSKKPVLMVLVLDRSASMDGTVDSNGRYNLSYSSLSNPKERCYRESESKLSRAKNSAIKFMDLLTEKDLFGVVTFDDLAFTEQELVHITRNNRNEVMSTIRKITTGGCTNISDSISKAFSMITEEHIKNYDCKIIVVSDGQANRGITDIDGLSTLTLKLFEAGVTISTLGIGLDYDSKILNAISTSGGGLFYHVEDLGLLDQIFKDELNLSRSTTAKGVKLLLELPNLIEISENLNSYTQEIKDDYIEVFIGDMHTKRSVIFEIKNNFVNEDIQFNIKVVYKTKDGADHIVKTSNYLKVVCEEQKLSKYKENSDIVKRVVDLIKNKAVVSSVESYENGNIIGLQNTFMNSSVRLDSIACNYTSVNVSQEKNELKDLETKYSSNSITRSMSKTMYASFSSSMRK